MLTATIPLVVMSYWIEGPFTGDGSVTLWQVSFYLGPLATAFCFCAVNGANRVLPGSFISTAMLGVPVLGLVFSSMFLGEVLSFTLIVGTLFICGGIFLVITSANRQ